MSHTHITCPETAVFRHLWAKSDPYHALWRHLLDVAAVCQALLPRFGSELIPVLPQPWLCLIVALHDIGKADALFQYKIESGGLTPEDAARILAPLKEAGLLRGVEKDKAVGFRHEARSAEWLEAHLTALGGDAVSIAVIGSAIRGHHADFNPKSIEDDHAAVWEPVRFALAEQIAVVLGADLNASGFPVSPFTDASAAGIRLSGLIVLSDWIASNDRVYPFESLAKESEANGGNMSAYFAAACAEAEVVVARLALDAIADALPHVSAFTLPPVPVPVPRFSDRWPQFPPRPIQQLLEDRALTGEFQTPGLALIEAPMGEGKTEAALYLAAVWDAARGILPQQVGGTYIALPTQATSNQMHKRYSDYLTSLNPGLSVRLVHGMAWLLDDPESTPAQAGSGGAPLVGETEPASRQDRDAGLNADRDAAARAQSWFQNQKRALIAPYGVGTIDQAMTAALNVRHGFLRLFGLAGKTLILDEVHAYDAFMTTILCRLLSWCRPLDIPVILLSATLSAAQKRRLVDAYRGKSSGEEDISLGDSAEPVDPPDPPDPAEAPYPPYPLLTLAPWDGGGTAEIGLAPAPSSSGSEDAKDKTARHVRVVREEGLLGDPHQVALLAARLARDGGCVCVLRNTVKAAQETYEALAQMKEAGHVPADTTLRLFHARYRACQRQEIERDVTGLFGKNPETGEIANSRRPERAIVLATQVVEQSLDVDFDVMITDVAPIDLLLQRSGRLWRHDRGPVRPGNRTEPVLHVLLPPKGDLTFGSTERKGDTLRAFGIYDREILLRTVALLYTLEADTLVLPRDFRPLIESVYGDTPLSRQAQEIVSAELLAAAQHSRITRQAAEEGAGRVHLVPTPNAKVFSYAQAEPPVDEAEEGAKAVGYFRAQTRLGGDDTRSVLVLHQGLQPLFDNAIKVTHRKAEEGNNRHAPGPKTLRTLFLQKATVPARWLAARTAGSDGSDGSPFEVVDKNKKPIRWLRHHAVVRLDQKDEWHGVGENGKPVVLRDDPILGLTFGSAAPADAASVLDTDD